MLLGSRVGEGEGVEKTSRVGLTVGGMGLGVNVPVAVGNGAAVSVGFDPFSTGVEEASGDGEACRPRKGRLMESPGKLQPSRRPRAINVRKLLSERDIWIESPAEQICGRN
jgi:hypothetical protein